MNYLDEELFKITTHDKRILIIPHHSNAVSNEGWTQDNLWCRSRVECIQTGDTISQGFGKFFNLGQGPDGLRIETSDIIDAIKNQREIIASLKHDGSCLIRSVHKGEVIFRTRGSMSYEFHDNARNEMGIFLDKYPKLLDPEWEPNRSLLFEWVTPDFQIVVKYAEPELYLLAAVDHGHRHYSHLRYLTMSELVEIAKEAGIQLTEYFTINSTKDWYDFYHEVINHRQIEGYVLRINNQQDLVKVKSQPYLTKHGLKSNLSFKNMVEFWLQHGQEGTYHGILGQLEKMYDEEVVMWALPFVENLFTAVEEWNRTKAKVESLVSEHSHWSRKDFAVKMQEKHKDLFALLMQVWQGKEINDKQIRTFMAKFDQGIKGQFDS